MEKFTLDKDIQVFCVDAETFPDDILKAHQTLHALLPFSSERRYFGLSRMEKGEIRYKAAAEELIVGELAQHGLQQMLIPSGDYQSILIFDYMKDTSLIGTAFNQLIQLPEIDPEAYCVEWYISDSQVRCMVRVI